MRARGIKVMLIMVSKRSYVPYLGRLSAINSVQQIILMGLMVACSCMEA